jgi:hypothetical protein
MLANSSRSDRAEAIRPGVIGLITAGLFASSAVAVNAAPASTTIQSKLNGRCLTVGIEFDQRGPQPANLAMDHAACRRRRLIGPDCPHIDRATVHHDRHGTQHPKLDNPSTHPRTCQPGIACRRNRTTYKTATPQGDYAINRILAKRDAETATSRQPTFKKLTPRATERI